MPRAGLSRPVVVEEAALLADDVGLDAVTLSALAKRFGVAQPSLYKHVAGLDDLRRALAVAGVGALGAALGEAAQGRAGRDALVAVAAAYRRFALDHPGSYQATVRAPEPGDVEHRSASDAVLATVLAVLRGYGIEGDDAVDAARTLRAALHGFAALEAAGGFGLPREVDRSFDRLVDALDVALRSWPA